MFTPAGKSSTSEYQAPTQGDSFLVPGDQISGNRLFDPVIVVDPPHPIDIKPPRCMPAKWCDSPETILIWNETQRRAGWKDPVREILSKKSGDGYYWGAYMETPPTETGR